MQLIRRQKSRVVVDAALRDPQWRRFLELPCGEHTRDYYGAVAGPDLDDHSFAFEDAGRVVALVECDVAGGAVGRFGFPVEPCIRPGLSFEVRRQLAVDIFAELQRIATARSASRVLVRSAPQNDGDGLLLGMLCEAGATARAELRAVVDLGHGDEALLADLRPGYRRHLRWADANLQMTFVDAAGADRGAFEAYRKLHAEVAGRVTRGASSWEAMFNAISRGHGDLVLGHWQGGLVSGTLVLDAAQTAYYASGAYRREMFDKPLSHGTMFAAIRRARGRGCTAFDVGDLPSRDAGANDKEIAIGHFKRGFCTRTLSSFVLTWESRRA